MAWVLTTIHRRHRGEDENVYGERLDRPFDGAEIGFFQSMADVWAAVATAEMRDWLVGVHYPLVAGDRPPAPLPITAADPAVRREALARAEQAALEARSVGARYIVFHLPAPAHATAGMDLSPWRHPLPPEPPAAVGAAAREAVREALETLAGVQERTRVEVVLELDGPSPLLYEEGLLEELMPRYGQLTLCVDTARLRAIAHTHGLDPVALARRWLPWTRHLHLAECRIAPGIREVGVPAHPSLTPAAGWAGAAAVAEQVVAAHPGCRIVLAHDPRTVPARRLEECHAWVRRLAGR